MAFLSARKLHVVVFQRVTCFAGTGQHGWREFQVVFRGMLRVKMYAMLGMHQGQVWLMTALAEVKALYAQEAWRVKELESAFLVLLALHLESEPD